MLGVALLVSFVAATGLIPLESQDGLTTWIAPGDDISGAGFWFIDVSSTVLQIALFRWLWRFGPWALFLLRVPRIKLSFEAILGSSQAVEPALKTTYSAKRVGVNPARSGSG